MGDGWIGKRGECSVQATDSQLTTSQAATAAAAAAAKPPPLPPFTTVVELTIIHCQRKRQQQQHHQRTNGSTKVKTFTSPEDLDLFNLSTVFEVCDVGRGNLAISKLVALKKFGPFLRSTYYLLDELFYIFGRC